MVKRRAAAAYNGNPWQGRSFVDPSIGLQTAQATKKLAVAANIAAQADEPGSQPYKEHLLEQAKNVGRHTHETKQKNQWSSKEELQCRLRSSCLAILTSTSFESFCHHGKVKRELRMGVDENPNFVSFAAFCEPR